MSKDALLPLYRALIPPIIEYEKETSFITNDTDKIQPKMLGRTFCLTSGAIVNDKTLRYALVNLRQYLTNTPDTFHFLTKLANQNIQNHIMVSSDVKSLFTNIQTSFTTQLILDNIFKNDWKEWNGLSRNRLKKLLT